MKRTRRLIVGAIGLALLASACSDAGRGLGTGAGEGAQSTVGDDAVVVYRFQDSSVPPQYHRSEELTIDRSTTRLVIDSYGDVLADESLATPPEIWRGLMASIASIEALSVGESPEGCVGGTSESIRVTSAGQIRIDMTADECAGANAQAGAAIRDSIAPARGLFATTETLAPTG